jgi:hypothetical protein
MQTRISFQTNSKSIQVHLLSIMRRKENTMKLNTLQIHRNFKQVMFSVKLIIKRIFSIDNVSQIIVKNNFIKDTIRKEKILKKSILKSRSRKTRLFSMKRFRNRLSVIGLLLIFSTAFYGGINNLETFASSDIDISYPNAYQPYSMTNPSGKPNFTAGQIAAQKINGEYYRNQIIAAAQNLSMSEYTIPAGNYGFAQSTYYKNAATFGFLLDGIKRPENNPFTIKAQGVTFWFDIMSAPAPTWGRAVYFNNCENIILEGLTIDTYERNAIEGSLSAIDIPNNRIEITLLDGTFNDEAKILAYPATFGGGGSQSRIIPIKPDGNLIAPLYNINDTWGPEYLFINGITKSATNKYWLNMRSNVLLNTIFTTNWLNAYGNEGTLQLGDGICLLYGVMGGVVVDNSKQITIKDTNCYIAKASIFEGGGYGNHKWINVHFSPRPGTNQILGGGENMSEGLRVGSLYDNCYFGLTSDDAINIHGFWGQALNINGNTTIFNRVPSGVAVGDIIEIYNNKNGALVYSYTISGINGAVDTDINGNRQNVAVTFTQTPDPSIVSQNADLWARYTSAECAGWVVRNCVFESNYQRILIQSGPGLFENNIVNSMGSGLHLYGNFYSYEGGFLNNITIQNNVFLNSSLSPNSPPIILEFTNMTTQTQWPTDISILDNLFVNAGGEAIRLKNAKNILIEGNIVTNPLVFTALAIPASPRATKVFTGSNVSNVTIKDNYLYEKSLYTTENKFYNGTATLTNNIAVTEFADTTTLGARDAYLSQKTAQQIISAVTPPAETPSDSSNLNNLSVVGSPFTENFTKNLPSLLNLYSYDPSHFSIIQNYQSIAGKSVKQSFINSTFGGIYALDTKNKLTTGGTYTLAASYKVLTDIMPTNFYFGFTRDGGLNQKNTKVDFTGNVKNTVYTFKREFTLDNFGDYFLQWFNTAGTDGSVIVIDSLILERLAAPTPIITFNTLSVSLDNVVSGFSKDTTCSDLISLLTTRAGVLVKFYYMGTLELSPGDFVGTNTTMKVFLDSVSPLYTYTTLLRGDIDEDGSITISDLAMIKSHLLKISALEGINLQAADMNSSSSVSISDLLAAKKEIILN